MIGDKEVIERLNKLLTSELTAIDQYFLHSRMYENWGFHDLYEHVNHEMTDEIRHAARLIDRILFLEGTPDLGKRDRLMIGSNVQEMLKNDLQLELAVVSSLRDTIAFCETKGDYQTREILEGLLEDTEEDHVYWLETQLSLIDKVGLQNYLQSHM